MSSRDEYVASMKSAFVSLATRLTLTWAVSLSPFFANIFLQKIIETIANHLFNFLAEQSELGIFFFYIDTRVGQQSRSFEDAAINYQKVLENGSKEDKSKAAQILWVEFKNFARLTS